MAFIRRVADYIRRNGAAYTLRRACGMLSERVLHSYDRQCRRTDPAPGELASQRANQPPAGLISIAIPAYNTRPAFLQALADSLIAQTYADWEAVIYDGGSSDAAAIAAMDALDDQRIRVIHAAVNEGISGNTNRAIAACRGDYVALCDHDDTLTPDALWHVAQAICRDAPDMLYSDEDKLDEDGRIRTDPHRKPDFCPDNLRSGNYICHLMVVRRTMLTELGGLRPDFDGSQDHDLALRATELAGRIVHIPRILYHWRMLDTSFSHQRAERCVQAACAAVHDQLTRLHIPGRVAMESLRVRIRYDVPETAVTAIIWGRGRIPALPAGMEILRVNDPAELNAAAHRAAGDHLLFLLAGMKPLDRSWLSELLMHAAREGVGCVGSAILDGERFYRHAGYAVDVPGGAVSHHAGQWLYGHPYMITDRTVRNVTGASAALMMIRRETFLQAGGFSEYASDLRGADLGLRCLQMGLANVYTPHARMLYRGTLPCLTAPAPVEDVHRFCNAWGEQPGERYYSPLFTRDGAMTIDFTQEAR